MNTKKYMRVIQNVILSVVLVVTLFACNQKSSGQSSKTNNALLQAFTSLETNNQRPDSGKTQHPHFIDQAYSLRGENKLFSGTLTNEYWKDSLKAKGIFENGKIQKFTSWYRNGNKNSEMIIQNEDTKAKFVTTTWYESGQLKSKYNSQTGIRYFKNGNVKTRWDETSATDYWRNGKRQVYWPLENKEDSSILHGPFKKWYSNGQLSRDGRFENGRKDGRWIHYDSLGKQKKIIIYENGVRDSTITPR